MRRPRAIVFDDEPMILHLLGAFLSRKGYEVVTFEEPKVCPLYEEYADRCDQTIPCGDIMITDFRMPKMDGAELIRRQAERGCRLGAENKAVISGDAGDEAQRAIAELGCTFFQKPLRLADMSLWLNEREQHMDLSQPLCPVERRRAVRRPYHAMVEYQTGNQSRNILWSLALNMSESGMCLYLFDNCAEGQRVLIRSLPPGAPQTPREATVRWTKKLPGTFCVAGLMFQ